MSPVQKVALLIALINKEYDIIDLVRKPKSRKTSPLNEPRYVAMLLIRRHTDYTFAWIGDHMKENNTQQRVVFIETRIMQEPDLLRKVAKIETDFLDYIKHHKVYEPISAATAAVSTEPPPTGLR